MIPGLPREIPRPPRVGSPARPIPPRGGTAPGQRYFPRECQRRLPARERVQQRQAVGLGDVEDARRDALGEFADGTDVPRADPGSPTSFQVSTPAGPR